jgi:hypothetical protein
VSRAGAARGGRGALAGRAGLFSLGERMGQHVAEVTPEARGRFGASRVRWTQKMKATFLDHLAASCCIAQAAAEVGVMPESVYYLRRKDKRFAAGWAEALEMGYEVLEIRLVGHALTGGGPAVGNGPAAAPVIDKDLALTLLTRHRGRATGTEKAAGRTARVASPEEVQASIMKKLARIAAGQPLRSEA